MAKCRVELVELTRVLQGFAFFSIIIIIMNLHIIFVCIYIYIINI